LSESSTRTFLSPGSSGLSVLFDKSHLDFFFALACFGFIFGKWDWGNGIILVRLVSDSVAQPQME